MLDRSLEELLLKSLTQKHLGGLLTPAGDLSRLRALRLGDSGLLAHLHRGSAPQVHNR